MRQLGVRRATALVAAVVAGAAVALAIWVVPAFSGGGDGRWRWVSGTVFHDNGIGTAVVSAYNGSSQPQDATAEGFDSDGTAVASTSPATRTIPPGQTVEWSWDCSSGLGCSRFYRLNTVSEDVAVSLVFDETDTTGLTYTGLIPPGGFAVFGPDGRTTAASVQSLGGATAALQAETAKLQTDTSALKGDTRKLRRDAKKLRKQLKRVLKAVR